MQVTVIDPADVTALESALDNYNVSHKICDELVSRRFLCIWNDLT